MSEKYHRVGIENGRAAYAFEAVKKAINNPKNGKKEYRSYVKKIPTLIQVNGLGQTLAFCYQKKHEYRVIYKQLHAWMKKNYPQYFKDETQEFVEAVVNLDSRDYRVLTMETLALLNWMRKFADGMVTKEEDDALPS